MMLARGLGDPATVRAGLLKAFSNMPENSIDLRRFTLIALTRVLADPRDTLALGAFLRAWPGDSSLGTAISVTIWSQLARPLRGSWFQSRSVVTSAWRQGLVGGAQSISLSPVGKSRPTSEKICSMCAGMCATAYCAVPSQPSSTCGCARPSSAPTARIGRSRSTWNPTGTILN